MQIKKSLKTYDVRISKLASDLGISRPTLDAYIEAFENGQTISNDIYQQIFEFLFGTESSSSIEFAQKYDYVKRVMLNRNKENQSIIDEREARLMENIYKSLNEQTVGKPLAEFINLFIENKENDLVKAIFTYFNYTNGFERMESSSIEYKDKAFFSQLSFLFDSYNDGTIQENVKQYEKVLERNKLAVEKKNTPISNDDIVNYIKKNLSGNKELDVEVLKHMLANMEDDANDD